MHVRWIPGTLSWWWRNVSVPVWPGLLSWLYRRVRTYNCKENGFYYIPVSAYLLLTFKIYQCTYTGCPRRNGQNFGRVFLRLNYTDITQNTYVQSWTVTEILSREKCGIYAGSTYCTCTAGWHVTLISHVLESVTHASTQWVGVVSALSAYREWRCGELYMRSVGFVMCGCVCMGFVTCAFW